MLTLFSPQHCHAAIRGQMIFQRENSRKRASWRRNSTITKCAFLPCVARWRRKKNGYSREICNRSISRAHPLSNVHPRHTSLCREEFRSLSYSTNPKEVRMSKTHSPTIFNGVEDNFYDPNFTIDINKRMRVPKSIRVSGDYTDDDITGTNGSGWNQAIPNEKFEMNVPDRILVVGQDQHIGTKAPPREMTLENAVMPPEPGMTPPRVLTLDDHYFPAVDEDDPNNFANSSIDPESTALSMPRLAPESRQQQIVRHFREQTPSYNALDVSLPPSEEIQHLRRQVGKLNRRVMAVELEILQRQQRDKILYAITITYFFLKAFSWLTRN